MTNPEHIHPTQEQIASFAELDMDAPIVMLNLLRFRDKAEPGLGADGLTGEQAYQLYASKFVEKADRWGAELVYAGDTGTTIIGPADEPWDLALLVRYTSARAFAEMTVDPEYRAISPLRTAGVADSRLIPTTPSTGPAA